jgi:hypothetical protein
VVLFTRTLVWTASFVLAWAIPPTSSKIATDRKYLTIGLLPNPSPVSIAEGAIATRPDQV